MPAIIIHNRNIDTAAFVGTLQGLEGINYTVVEEDLSRIFLFNYNDVKKQFHNIFAEVMGLFDVHLNKQGVFRFGKAD